MKQPESSLYSRLMNANLSSIMPQVVGVWCRNAGHEVTYVCYTGRERLVDELPQEVDLIFVSAFTEAAPLAYAISNLFRSRGAVTVLGGPHARCYPDDARRFFDYVLGFTDQGLIGDLLADGGPQRPLGMHLAAERQPTDLPGVRERWPFLESTLKKAPLLKIVPMLGSVGCPYTCPFCIDAAVPYQQMDLDELREDLQFLLTKFRKPMVGWHDPNFGVRFDDSLDVIEEAVPPGSIDFVAESSLSILSEPRLQRLRRAGFVALLPGIESWFDLGGKSRTGRDRGVEKMEKVSEHVRMLLRYIPYVQTNFVLGLDSDQGAESFELTKRFIDKAPGAFPGYSLLTSFGQASKLNLQYQRDGRVLPFPFFFLNNNQAMNVRPADQSWPEFYDRVIDLVGYTFAWPRIARRFGSTPGVVSRLLNLVRSVSSEGFGRLRYHREIRRRLDHDPEFRPFFEQETTRVPRFYVELMRKGLGPFWEWLPEGSLEHDACAYLHAAGVAGTPDVVWRTR